MRKFMVLILLLCLISFTGHSQNQYSIESLEKASQEELDIYLIKSLKLQKTGKTLNIIGLTSLGVIGACGLLGSDITFGVDSWALIGVATGAVISGVTSFAIGIPANLIGKSRVKRINTLKGTSYYNIKIDLKPCAQYNLKSQNHLPGIAISLRF